MQLSVHSFMQLTAPKPAARLAGLLLSAAFISGCASTTSAPQSYATYAKTPQFLASDISNVLTQARAGQQLSFSNSPWGPQVTVQVLNRYFSASGRECLQLQLNNSETTDAVVCQYNDQQWVVNRDLTVAYLPQE